MELNDARYKNQGIHVITAIFTVEKGVTKVLLVRRTNEPYRGKWILTGGALYNNENLIEGAHREIEVKSGLKNLKLHLMGVYGDVNRSPIMRMVGIAFVALIDSTKVNILKKTTKTDNADWFPIDKIPDLGYDHNEIIRDALEFLKREIVKVDILRDLFPSEFTLPELQQVFEAILGIKLDRRNFRSKLLRMKIIEETGNVARFKGNKPAKLYRLSDVNNESIF